jgi:putative ABC transport system substrate-binding protein
MVATADPVGIGFVSSLSQPGRNITGLSTLNVDLSSKYLELLRAAAPKISRVAVLMDTGSVNFERRLQLIQSAGQTISVKILPVLSATASEIDAAFATMKQERAGALIVWPSPFFRSQGQRIAKLATQHRLPSMSAFREYAESGGLMSYGQNLAEQYYRAATYVDKIFKGAKPADLPVEQPTKFELVINLKTAKALGLTNLQELLFRADKVIE